MTAVFFDPDDFLERDPATARDELEAARLRHEAEQRAELCRAITRRVAEAGFEATSAQQVFRAAELGSGTFYKHFEDRQECLLEAFERCAEATLVRMAAAAAAGGEDFDSRLRAGLGEVLDLLRANPDVARLLLIEVRAGDAACREAQQRWLGRFAGHLAGGKAGELRSGSLAWMTAGALESLLTLTLGAAEPEQAGLEELVWVAELAQRGAAAEARISTEGEAGDAGPASAGIRRRAGREGRRQRQRARLLEAMIEIAGTKGYSATRLSDVYERARLSRPQFYESFGSKEECLLAAFDGASASALERVKAAMADARAPGEAAEVGLGELLDSLAERPAAARVLTIEARAVGTRGEERYREALASFTRAITEAMGNGQAEEEIARTVAATVASLIAREVGEGRAGQLERLLPELVFTALAPCMGGEKAAKEMHRVGKERRREMVGLKRSD